MEKLIKSVKKFTQDISYDYCPDKIHVSEIHLTLKKNADVKFIGYMKKHYPKTEYRLHYVRFPQTYVHIDAIFNPL